MARTKFAITTGEIATGTSAKYLLMVKSTTNRRMLLNNITVSFKGTDLTGAPIRVQLMRTTTNSSYGTAVTPAKLISAQSESLAVTALQDFSDDVGGTEIHAEEVHPAGGGMYLPYRFGEELELGPSEFLAIKVTAAASVSAIATVKGEE